MKTRLPVAAGLTFAVALLAAPADARKPRLGPRIRVQWTFPQRGLTSVFTDEVRVRFNRKADPYTVDASSFQLLIGGTSVPGTREPDDPAGSREWVFTPDKPLFREAQYVVRVTGGVTSRRGRPLDPEFAYGFSTSPFKEGVRPVRASDFTAGPQLGTGRAFHTASRGGNGDVVIAGGQAYDGTALASTEIFRTGFVHPAGDLRSARRKHAATVLRDGTVMVSGGFGAAGPTLASSELFDPVTETWVALPPMLHDRASHTSTLLADGRVLVVGGYSNATGPLAYERSAELYNPFQRTWTALPAPVAARGSHTATELQDGRILLLGGEQAGIPVAEIFDPLNRTFRATGGQPAGVRVFHAAALLRDGRVLVAGGGPTASEVFEPGSEAFTDAGENPVEGIATIESSSFATLTTLDPERALYLGGMVPGGAPGGADLVLESLQLWTPGVQGGTGQFYPMTFATGVPRAAHTITDLGDGSYLVAGGFGTDGVSNERRTTILRPSN